MAINSSAHTSHNDFSQQSASRQHGKCWGLNRFASGSRGCLRDYCLPLLRSYANTQIPHKQQLGILWLGRRISRERPGILREASGFRGEPPGFRGWRSGFCGSGSGQRGRRVDFAGAAQTWRERGRISRAVSRIFRERAGTLRERPRILRERRRQRRQAAVQPSLRASLPVWLGLRPGRSSVFPSLRRSRRSCKGRSPGSP